MFHIFTAKQSIWQVIKSSFHLYRASFVKNIPWLILITLILTARMAFDYFNMFSSQALHMLILNVLIGAVIMLFFYCCLLYQTHDVLRGHSAKFLAITKTGIVRGCILLLMYLALFVFLLVFIKGLLLLEQLSHQGWYRMLIIVIFTVVMLYLALICSVWFPLIVITRHNPWQALRQALTLLKNNAWATLALYFVVLIITLFIYAVFILLFNLLIIFHFRLLSLFFLLLLLPGVIGFFIIPWFSSVVLLQVHNLQLQLLRLNTRK